MFYDIKRTKNKEGAMTIKDIVFPDDACFREGRRIGSVAGSDVPIPEKKSKAGRPTKTEMINVINRIESAPVYFNKIGIILTDKDRETLGAIRALVSCVGDIRRLIEMIEKISQFLYENLDDLGDAQAAVDENSFVGSIIRGAAENGNESQNKTPVKE